MKKSLILAAVISLMSFAAHAETDKITVNGMVCAFCAQGLKTSFGKMSNVNYIDVNLDNMLVTIHTDKDHPLSDDTIKQAVKENGLDTVRIERTTP